jgi:hypothetical protein
MSTSVLKITIASFFLVTGSAFAAMTKVTFDPASVKKVGNVCSATCRCVAGTNVDIKGVLGSDKTSCTWKTNAGTNSSLQTACENACGQGQR